MSAMDNSVVYGGGAAGQSTPWDVSAGRYSSSVVVAPDLAENNKKSTEKNTKSVTKSSIIELANNSDYSIETIAKEAKRLNEREGEVFISLH